MDMKKNLNLNKYDKEKYFINPYNFIPIEEYPPERKEQERGTKSGRIKCKMRILSPTFIPNTTADYQRNSETKKIERIEPDEQDKRDKGRIYKVFYSYENLENPEHKEMRNPENPVIPGSSIRGMIRNIYEQLTNSCFLNVDDNNLPYKRTIDIKQPGILKYDNDEGVWKLYGNLTDKRDYYRCDFEKDNLQHLRTGAKCSRKSGGKIVEENNGQWTVHRTAKFKNNHKQVIYKENSGKLVKVLEKEDIQRLKNVVASYMDIKIHKKQNIVNIYKQYKQQLDAKKTIFVYYDNCGTVLYLSPACITKEFFANTIGKILDEQNHHNKCKDMKEACPACRLFGMVGDTGSLAGKVRFMDTHQNEQIKYKNEEPLPILGTPKISATEFYLAFNEKEHSLKDDEIIANWNYDYFTKYKEVKGKYAGKSQSKANKYEETRSREPYKVKLRGRKVYWHGDYKQGAEQKNAKMSTTVNAINSGDFYFYVYFDGLTEDELNNLIFCLQLNKEAIHKIGMGKPVGMGDVKITIEALEYRKYLLNADGTICSVPEGADLSSLGNVNSSQLKNILRYTTELDSRERSLVSYPLLEREEKNVYNWFENNRGGIGKLKINQKLPLINAKDLTLKRTTGKEKGKR